MLLAATRIASAPPHLGTLYGWLKHIRLCSKTHQVVVLIADLQSLQHDASFLKSMLSTHEAIIRRFVPSTVPVVFESHVRHLLPLAEVLALMLPLRPLLRFPAIKAAQANGTLSFGMLAYPLLMAADAIAFGALFAFGTEQQFNQLEFVNAASKKLIHMGVPAQPVQSIRTPAVKIIDNTGERIRRSTTAPYFDPISTPAEAQRISRWIMSLEAPSTQEDSRFETCKPIRSLWAASGREEIARQLCINDKIECQACKTRLQERVLADVAISFGSRELSISHSTIIQTATRNARSILSQLHKWSVPWNGHPIAPNHKTILGIVSGDIAVTPLFHSVLLSVARRYVNNAKVTIIVTPQRFDSSSLDFNFDEISARCNAFLKMCGARHMPLEIIPYFDFHASDRRLMEHLFKVAVAALPMHELPFHLPRLMRAARISAIIESVEAICVVSDQKPLTDSDPSEATREIIHCDYAGYPKRIDLSDVITLFLDTDRHGIAGAVSRFKTGPNATWNEPAFHKLADLVNLLEAETQIGDRTSVNECLGSYSKLKHRLTCAASASLV